MVFIGGPRQVGKTTLGISLLHNYYDGHPAYLNWDQSEARSIIQKGTWPKDEPLIIFDEIHKRKGWQVGSPFSYRSFAEDLEVSDKTIKRWVKILDSLYYCYLIPPFGSTKIKAIKKSQKLYLWDWSQIPDPGSRFENMVASHLLKLCDYWQDVMGYRCELRYIRDEKGREVDFVVLRDRKALFALECKLTDSDISESMVEFKKKLDIPKWYQVHMGTKSRLIAPDFLVLPFADFCKEISAV